MFLRLIRNRDLVIGHDSGRHPTIFHLTPIVNSFQDYTP